MTTATDAPNAGVHYESAIRGLNHMLRKAKGPRMSIEDYSNLARATHEIRHKVGVAQTSGQTRLRKKLLALLRKCESTLRRSAHPRLLQLCHETLKQQWMKLVGGDINENLCLFTVSGFHAHYMQDTHHETYHLLPEFVVAPRAGMITQRHMLLHAPVWFRELLLAVWRAQGSTWRIVAEDVPDGCPVLGVGEPAYYLNQEEYDATLSLWSDDPDAAFFEPETALEAARLI